MWGLIHTNKQEANPVANKSEYIRERYALGKSLKGLKYKQPKKENWMFCKVYKENQKELEKCTTSIVCVSYEQLSDLQLILVIVDTTAAPVLYIVGQ